MSYENSEVVSKEQDNNPESFKTSRAEFLKNSLLGVLGGFAALVLGNKKGESFAEDMAKEKLKIDEIQFPEPEPDEDVIIRMGRELQEALKKPVEKRHWIMVIDLRKCVGCRACTVSCISENKLPPGVVYRPVMEEEIGEFPNVRKRFLPRPCMHCDDPPCTPVCPVRATYKRPDGIVVIDYEKCIGCRYCVTACPYGARSFDFGENFTDGLPKVSENEKAPSFEYSRKWKREGQKSPIGNARKCHFCLHRIEQGLLPQCVVTCIGRATFFGDKNNPRSLVSELIGQPNVMRLKEELGTEPSVYYLL